MFTVEEVVGHPDIPGRVCLIFPCKDNTYSDGRCAVDVQSYRELPGLRTHHVVAAFPCRQHVQEYLRLTP